MTSSDTYVYDLSNEVDANPHIFMRKEYATCLDQSTGNYASNTSIIETSSLSNASKWVNYYEAKLLVPLSIFLTSSINGAFNPTATPCDFALGMKNTFLTLIHSINIQYNSVSITSQTGYSSLWNTFKLQTSLNVTDYASLASICFAPDTLTSVSYSATSTISGMGTMNNSNYASPEVITGLSNKAGLCNIGFLQRQNFLNYNPATNNSGVTTTTQSNLLYKSYCQSVAPSATNSGIWALFAVAEIRLRDLHDFFASAPLLKGSFLRLQLLLNNTSFGFTTTQINTTGPVAASMTLTSMSSAQAGVNPLMLASLNTDNGAFSLLYPTTPAAAPVPVPYIASIQVGATCLNTSQLQAMGTAVLSNPMLRSVTLSVPQYTFSPEIEMSYIQQGTKRIVFDDIFQYTIVNVQASSGTINALINNGIQGAQEMLVVPIVSSSSNQLSSAGNLALPAFQSPYDPCGGGPSGYIAQLTNLQVLVAGSSLLMKNAQYVYESFGQNYQGQAGQTNGNLNDGMGSGLVDQLGFWYSPFYYFNLSRGLASDDQVLKSITLLGTNTSNLQLDLYVFISHRKEITVDLRTGAMV